jgi:acetoin utilization deacetylase AcuC-like enzyme
VNVYYCDTFVLPLPSEHSFPMQKYALLREAVTANLDQLGAKLVLPERATDEDLARVHCPAYIQRVMDGSLSAAEQRKIGFPWSMQMAERSRRVSGATKAALADAISGDGVAINLAGGTHHAFYDSGGGYCIFNDAVVAARAAIAAGRCQRVLVIDLDVHQGNGTASLCEGDASITTFSMHGEKNYPAVKQRSDIDVNLASGTDDATYLALLNTYLPRAFELAKADAVIYLAGADPFEHDRLGFLRLSFAGLQKRDRTVFQACLARGLPVAVAMAGGYAPNVEDIVRIHLQTVQEASNFSRLWDGQHELVSRN